MDENDILIISLTFFIDENIKVRSLNLTQIRSVRSGLFLLLYYHLILSLILRGILKIL